MNKSRREYQKEWYLANKDKALAQAKEYRAANKDKIRAYYAANKDNIKEYQATTKDRIKTYQKEWNAANKDRRKEYQAANKDKIRAQQKEYQRYRRATNLNFKIACNLRSRLRHALNGNYKTGSAVRDLGCSIDELKLKFIPLFAIGMNWENYGSLWHIDHIRPCASFDLTDPEQVKLCCHFSNLQPLWAADNLAKSDRY